MPKVTAIVVGAGLAGLSAAYSLAKEGIDVLVVERGEYPGAKSMTGGRLYFLPIKNLYPELWVEAPWERHVVEDVWTIIDEGGSLSVTSSNQSYNVPPYHSFTVLASRFNRWFAQKVSEKGARIINKYRVDELILDRGKVKGVIVGGSKIEADVVIAADGIMSQIAEKAGLRSKFKAQNFALGVKEVINLSPGAIEERFGLGPDEGAARLFIGSLTKGMIGAGFLYTNRDSISLGMVLGIKDMADCNRDMKAYELLEEFKLRPEMQRLIQGGESVEYSAHVLAEGGLKTMPRLFGDGVLITGDAAGMTMNLGLTVRGMDYALASGALAAKAVAMAKQQNDFSAATLSRYQDLLKSSFVWKDFVTFREAPETLSNPRLFTEYPHLVCEIMAKLMAIGEGPKEKLSTTLCQQFRGKRTLSLLKDLFRLRRI
ncbi:MAG: FAD-dependent oxidoreductase [Chloroflexota bacterium]